MLTTKRMTKLALAIGLSAALVSPSMAQSLRTSNHPAHHEIHSNRTAPQTNGGPYYYEGSDNGSVWSYYPGYKAAHVMVGGSCSNTASCHAAARHGA